MGCCMLLRKKVFAKVGFLSEDFFMYGEEDEWCWRVKHNGYETWYVAAAEVKHLNESSFAPNRMQQRVLARSKFYKNTNTLWCGSLICIIDLIYYATSIVSIVFKSMFSRASKSHLRLYINALIRESVLFKQIIMGLLASTSSPGSIEIR
jgi:GT2 family glycosyltransferase